MTLAGLNTMKLTQVVSSLLAMLTPAAAEEGITNTPSSQLLLEYNPF